MEKRVSIWVAGTAEEMSVLQKALYVDDDSVSLRMPCCIIQDARSKSSAQHDSDAFLQCYIEAVAQVAADIAQDQQDKCFASPGQHIDWPCIWLTKVLESVDVKEDEEKTVEDIVYRVESETGVHTAPIFAKQLALQSLSQLCVPVSIGAIQAGLAYLRLYGDMNEECLRNSIYLDEQDAERILRDFRAHQAGMLNMLLSLPRVSVVTPHAIR